VEETPYDALELELAVTRARTYLIRAVFPAGARVTVGRDADCVLRFDDEILPPIHELFRLGGAGAGLRFARDMRVELARAGRILTTADLEEKGLAETDGDELVVPLSRGVKGLVRFGELGLLFKVQDARNMPVRVTSADDDRCAACSTELRHVLVGGGALTPCPSCGVLNEVGGVFDGDGPLTEDVEDTVSDLGSPARSSIEDVVQPFDDLSTGSSPGVVKVDVEGADLPTFDAIEAKKALDLPTFDAIEVAKATDLPTFDALPAKEPLFAAGKLGAEPSKGADLPTFDAISVVREQGFSTQAAISVLKGGEEGDPGGPAAAQLGPPVRIDMDSGSAPVPSADLDNKATAPAIHAVKVPEPQILSAPKAGFDLPDDPVESIKNQAGLSTDAALELMRGGSGDKPPARRTEEVTDSRAETPSEPDLFSDEFSESMRAPPGRAELAARGVSLPQVNAVPVPDPDITNSAPPADGGDDFLMGRTDLDPSELADRSRSGLMLYAIGLIAGGIGIVLILLRLLS